MSTFELIYNAPFTAQVEVKEPTGSSVHPGMGWLPGADPPLPCAVVIPCIGMYLFVSAGKSKNKTCRLW